jgi:hypothetical protein
MHISHKITPLKTNKQNKEKQISSHSYTNSQGIHVEKGKEIKLRVYVVYFKRM